MMINGNLYDWASMEIHLPGGLAIGIQSIDYDDERPVEERYGKGSVPRGYGRGNYKATAKIELDLDAAEQMRLALGGSVYDGIPFLIVVCYAPDLQPTVIDMLPQCKIVKTSTGSKQEDKNAGTRKYDLKLLAPIVWGGIPAVVRK